MKGIGEITVLIPPPFFHGFRSFPAFFLHDEGLVKIPVSQSVKEVLQSLVDDNLVQADKIGSSNCEGLFTPPRSDHLVTLKIVFMIRFI